MELTQMQWEMATDFRWMNEQIAPTLHEAITLALTIAYTVDKLEDYDEGSQLSLRGAQAWLEGRITPEEVQRLSRAAQRHTMELGLLPIPPDPQKAAVAEYCIATIYHDKKTMHVVANFAQVAIMAKTAEGGDSSLKVWGSELSEFEAAKIVADVIRRLYPWEEIQRRRNARQTQPG